MATIFSITDFGATCAPQLQTAAIQAAIDACFAAGGGRVTVPAGTFLTGSIRLRSRVTLHLQAGAVLKGSRDPQDYFGYRTDAVEPLAAECITDSLYTPPSMRMTATYEDSKPEFDFLRVAGSRWNNALIRAFDAEDIAIEGEEGSVIDGSNTYDALGEEQYRGPHAITLFHCTNVQFMDAAPVLHWNSFSPGQLVANRTVCAEPSLPVSSDCSMEPSSSAQLSQIWL